MRNQSNSDLSIYDRGYNLTYDSSSEEIKNTNMVHLAISNKYYSPKNTLMKTVVSKPIGDALMSFFDGSINAISITSKDYLYIDMSVNKINFPVINDGQNILISDIVKKESVRANEAQINVIALISAISYAMYKDKSSELSKWFGKLQDMVSKDGLPIDMNETKNQEVMFNLISYITNEVKELFPFKENDIIVGPIVTALHSVTKDITKDYTKRSGTFKASTVVTTNNTTVTADVNELMKSVEPMVYDNPFTEDEKTLLATLDDINLNTFRKDYIEELQYIRYEDVCFVMFYGESGGGKTYLAEQMIKIMHMPPITINGTSGIDEYALFGKFQPADNSFIFKEGPFTEAFKKGYALIYNELNGTEAKRLMSLYGALDHTAIVRLDDGTVVKRHPNFRMFATMNVGSGYAGTKTMSIALKNRLALALRIEPMSDVEIKNIVHKDTGCDPVLIGKMISVYKSIRENLEHDDIDICLSIRNIEGWANMCKYKKDPYKAAIGTVVNIAGNFDKEKEEELKKIVKMKFPSV